MNFITSGDAARSWIVGARSVAPATPPRVGESVTMTGEGEHEVTVMVRAQCPACDVAKDDVARICGELFVPWSAADVDQDPELRSEYGDRVPVILVDGREHGFWKVEEERLRAALTR